jgi:cytochrome c oxidase subunit 2
MTDQHPAGSVGVPAGPRHGRRIAAIWIVLSVIGDVIWWAVASAHVPPGNMTSSAGGAQFDFNVLFMAALPVIIGVWSYMGYAVVNWRHSKGGPPAPGGPRYASNLRLQVAWIATSSAVVFGAFVFGTAELIIPAGAGGGEGPQPIWTPSAKTVLPVQVIAQQWKFSYRYPTFGGFETDQLVLPVHTTIAFHVTSLDVIHDFWAYQLGVKADANPGSDDVAFTEAKQTGSFTVRCDELCGIWHGAMYNYGTVVSKAAFARWATRTEARLAAATRLLPPFSWTYTPDANGADGSYYPDSVDPYSKVEVYGAGAVSAKSAALPTS